MTSITPITGTVTKTGAPSAPATDRGAARAARPTVVLSGTAFVQSETLGAKASPSVRERFSTLQARFLPAKAKGVNARFQFNLSGPGGGQWYCEIKGGKLTVKEGTGPNPTATLIASASDYKKIADGEMNKMFAFVRGKLKVKGDKEAIKQWDTYFKKP